MSNLPRFPLYIPSKGRADHMITSKALTQMGVRHFVVVEPMQVAVHPDISTLVWKFKRWHHHVDYSGFKKHKLIRNSDVHIDSGVNNYGMELLQR